MNERYLEYLILEDALKAKKIAIISGPRQVGKTTLAKKVLHAAGSSQNYYTWDDDEFRKIWIQSPKRLIENQKNQLIVLDEIHKDRKWKNKLKGLYDLFNEDVRFIVTGSARMDYFRKSGDSLQGRYFPYRMHPFTLFEKNHLKAPPESLEEWMDSNVHPSFDMDDLLELSGFPEPLFGGSASKAQRWKRLYRERMIREDVRDFQNVRDVHLIENLALLLSEKVGGTVSYSSLREDLSCSFESVLRWIEVLEAVYHCYRIRPYAKKIKNSILKEPKLFLYDWSTAQDPGARWENFIAGHLLKSVHAWTDAALGEFDLFYVRDKQKREVDFLITQDGKPYLLLEVKSNRDEPTPSLIYFNGVLKPKFCFQLIRDEKRERPSQIALSGIKVISAKRFLAALN